MKYLIHTIGKLDVIILPALEDNYIYILVQDGRAAVVDPADAATVQRVLHERQYTLTDILITHHHFDHVAGNETLKEETECMITGPDDSRVPGLDRSVGEGDRVRFDALDFQVLATPGHSASHISFYDAATGILLCGDTMFAAGCGRVLEGRPRDLWMSLNKLAMLPDDTLIFCGHEYTVENLRFALTLEPDNTDIQNRMTKAESLRREGQPTIPSTLALEKLTNPFLRTGSQELRRTLGLESASDFDVFAAARRRKDVF